MLSSFLRWLTGKGTARSPLEVVIYGRKGCHLCDEALAVLRAYQAKHQLRIEERDIDGDPDLAALYGEKLPVVTIGGDVRFFGRINEVLLRRLLRHRSPHAPREEPSRGA